MGHTKRLRRYAQKIEAETGLRCSVGVSTGEILCRDDTGRVVRYVALLPEKRYKRLLKRQALSEEGVRAEVNQMPRAGD